MKFKKIVLLLFWNSVKMLVRIWFALGRHTSIFSKSQDISSDCLVSKVVEATGEFNIYNMYIKFGR